MYLSEAHGFLVHGLKEPSSLRAARKDAEATSKGRSKRKYSTQTPAQSLLSPLTRTEKGKNKFQLSIGVFFSEE